MCVFDHFTNLVKIFNNVASLGPYWGHVLAILGSCLGCFHNIFASRCLKLLKCSRKSHACQIEEYSLIFNCWDHIDGCVWPTLGPCFGYFYNIFACRCLKWLKFSLKSHECQIEKYFLIFNCWNHIDGRVWATLGHVLAISTIYLPIDA